MRRTVTLTILLVFVLSAQLSWAQIPEKMSYQGLLTDGSGNPVANGSYNLVFSIYNVATGGSALWSETQSVGVVNGIFNVILGSVNPLTADFGQQYWLGVTIVGAGSELTPRVQLTSSAYSLNARTVIDRAVTTVKLADDAVTGPKLADNVVSTTHILGATIIGDDIANGVLVRSINLLKDDVTLAAGTNVTITPSGNTLTISATGAELPDGAVTTSKLADAAVTTVKLAGNAVTVGKIQPDIVSSVDGVSNDGGNIDLVPGANVTITPDDTANTITISATGAGGDSWKLTGNAGTNPATHFLGTTDEVPLEFRVGGRRLMSYSYIYDRNPSGPNIIGGHPSNTVGSDVVGATVFGGGAGGTSPAPNSVDGNFGTVSGGWGNTASGKSSTVGGGEDNTTSGEYATIGGGYDNEAYGSTIGGGQFNTASAEDCTIGGGFDNKAYDEDCTVGGGSGNSAGTDNSSVTDALCATVGGGHGNQVSAAYGTIAGGGRSNPVDNTTANRVTDNYGTIGGGGDNQAGNNADPKDDATYATVGGGKSNEASHQFATVSGGAENIASGYGAMVAGGVWNEAKGECSFAAGREAKANHDGCFVWSDNAGGSVVTSAENEFRARASNGFYFYTTGGGAFLASGATSWSGISDRGIKENFTPVDAKVILEKLAAMPVQEYKLKAQDTSIRHIGPVAQDFAAVFGYGESDIAINMQDADGVALAAIQGLYELVKEKDAENAALKQQVDDLEARLKALESLISPQEGVQR